MPFDQKTIRARQAAEGRKRGETALAIVTARAARAQEDIRQEKLAKVIQLPLWPDDKRAMPTEFIGCALFGAVRPPERERDEEGKRTEKPAPGARMELVEIANAHGVSIRYSGVRLSQVHADVLQGIFQLARNTVQPSDPAANWSVRFRCVDFLRLIGRGTTGAQRRQLMMWLDDLGTATLRIVDKSKGIVEYRYRGVLIPKQWEEVEEQETRYVVEINPELARLFQSGFGLVDWGQRKRLRSKWLALWMQQYFSRFTKSVSVSELHRLSGSTASLKEFRRMLSSALDDLAGAGGHRAFVDKTNDLVRAGVATQELAAAGRERTEVLRWVDEPSEQEAAATLPLPTSTARKQFEQFRPGESCDECLADWHKWLRKRKLGARNTDHAFLGFARVWRR